MMTINNPPLINWRYIMYAVIHVPNNPTIHNIISTITDNVDDLLDSEMFESLLDTGIIHIINNDSKTMVILLG